MRIIIQRVSEASVTIDSVRKSKIGLGYLILLGIDHNDDLEDIKWLSNKICNLRIFNDNDNKMNLSIKEVNGDILTISQFTLFATTKKGNRPSFTKSAKPEIAIPLYNQFITQLETKLNKPIYSGEFGADMKISLINDGPVTISIDSKNRE